MLQKIILVAFILALPFLAEAKKKQETKGTLPELQIKGTNEEENQKKSLQSEVMITKTENAAIQSLEKIIKKRRGTPDEADLWYRLAELYMRRAKSGRFFDLNRNSENKALNFVAPEIRGQNASQNLRKAIGIYQKIESNFRKYPDMDAVLFNTAFAFSQLNQKKMSEQYFLKMTKNHPDSQLFPDAQLALGEMKYEASNFNGALPHFLDIQNFPDSKVYSYGIYKSAWTLYNLRDTDKAIDQLVKVVNYHSPSNPDAQGNHDLRQESIRDLTIFIGETHAADKAYDFFDDLVTKAELADAMIQLGKLYDSHSRFKEMNTVLGEFIDKNPTSPTVLKAHLMLAQANETARNRNEALKQLEASYEVCAPDSKWSKANVEKYDEACNYDYAKVNLDLAKKWWELWQKNKTSKDAVPIAKLAKRAFQLRLEREDPKKPDAKSRYAYSELLFQTGDYQEASKQYEMVGDQIADTQIRHDANYASLVSYEKIKNKKTDETLRLSLRYLEKEPKGEHNIEVKFKVGFTYYEKNQMDKANEWLRPLALNPKAGPQKRKAEDLVLDMMNAKKDYKGIKEFSNAILAQTSDTTRKSDLVKITQEAEYSEIQAGLKKGEETATAEKLYSFYQKNKGFRLAKESLWQTLSLYYTAGFTIKGADLSIEYVNTYPDDPRSLEALKDAAKNYAENGLIIPAADTFMKLSKKSAKEKKLALEAASELYILEGKNKEARQTIELLMSLDEKSEQGKYLVKILQTMKGEEQSPAYQKIEAKLVSLGEEPYASQIKFRKVKALFEAKKYPEAFSAAKSLVGNEKGVDTDVRAEARLIQALVLEDEFIKQSTKASIERFQTVIALKTEKLDKAQQAFLSSAKIAKDSNVKLKAMQGLERIYKNYITTVAGATIKEIPEEEQKLLSDELAKLVTPFKDKHQDIVKKLSDFAAEDKTVQVVTVNWEQMSGDDLPPVQMSLPQISQLKSETDIRDRETDKIQSAIKKKDLELAHKEAIALINRDSKNPYGTYFLSVIADQKGQFEKALWLIDLSLKKGDNVAEQFYQKGKVLFALNNQHQAHEFFTKASKKGLDTPILNVLEASSQFAANNCYGVVDSLDKLRAKDIEDFKLAHVLAECRAQKGQTDEALSVLKKASQTEAVLLELARVYELYKMDRKAALQTYEKLQKSNAIKDPTRMWVTKKINHLQQSIRNISSAEVEK